MMSWYHSADEAYTCQVCGERFYRVEADVREEAGATVDGVTEHLGVMVCPYCGSEEIA